MFEEIDRMDKSLRARGAEKPVREAREREELVVSDMRHEVIHFTPLKLLWDFDASFLGEKP